MEILDWGEVVEHHKHSSLLGLEINYDCQAFYCTGLWAVFATLHSLHNLQMFPKARVFAHGKPFQPHVM